MNNTLVVIAKITPKTEHYEDVKASIIAILEETRSEAGCHQFQLNEERNGQHLVLYEEWQDQAALDCHYAQPYVTRVFESYASWLAQSVEITTLSKVA